MANQLRYINTFVIETLNSRAVFIGGPRQVGKTTFALSHIHKTADTKHPAYLNWDHFPSADKIKRTELPTRQKTLVFDELHKFKLWKRWIKGVIDVEKGHRKIIVTGSARLDLYQKGGDSLFGRYRYVRLHPFSYNEYLSVSPKGVLEDLIIFGGFPEPLFTKKQRQLKLWQRERTARIVREDVRDIANIQNLGKLEQLVDLLPQKVGNPLSVKSLCEDVEIDHKTAKSWLTVLESMYLIFRISPFGAKKIRAVKKEQKLYLWDWSCVESVGARWENLVASQLLKYCHWQEDSEGEVMELRFLRDIDKREIDFVVLKNKKPLFAVECKSGDTSISPNIHYFAERTDIPKFYQVHRRSKSFAIGKIEVLPFTEFCIKLGMP